MLTSPVKKLQIPIFIYIARVINKKQIRTHLNHLQHLYIQQQQRWLNLDHVSLHASCEQPAAKLEFDEPPQFVIINDSVVLKSWHYNAITISENYE